MAKEGDRSRCDLCGKWLRYTFLGNGRRGWVHETTNPRHPARPQKEIIRANGEQASAGPQDGDEGHTSPDPNLADPSSGGLF